MDCLSDKKSDSRCRIRRIKGTGRFISRLTAMGFTENAIVYVIQNRGNNPVLVFARDTTVAIGKREARDILVEEASA